MRRNPFLSLFFIGLSVAFVVVLAIRIRHDAQEPVPGDRIPVEQPAAVPAQAKATEPASKASATTVRLESAREHATPQGPRSVRAVEPKPSRMTRILAPLVKAMTAVAKATQPPASKAATKGGAAVPAGAQVARHSTPTQDQQSSKDPNSDSTPPQLLSIAFDPPQIHDGEESTAVITATDDLSGIRGISGTIASPTGKALQGFAAQHEADSNRWLARVVIPKNAEQGTWKVRFLNLSDNASNSITLNDAQGTIPPTAILRVASADSDSTPPVLKNIWVDRRAMHGGEKNIVYVDATDDNSGVSLVSLVFRSPSKLARIGAGCELGDGGIWRCELSTPACLDCGDWQLEQVTLQDKANNLITYRQDNPIVQAVRINIQGDSCDNSPPTLQSVTLNSNDIADGPNGAVVIVTIAALDDACGVSGASGQYSGPSPGSGGVFAMRRVSEGTWQGQIQLDAHAPRGLWRINSIQLSDQGYNLKVVYGNDPLLQNATFRVH